jgi:hypothetical protein
VEARLKKEIRASRRIYCCTAGRLLRTMARSVVVVTGESWAAAAAVDWGVDDGWLSYWPYCTGLNRCFLDTTRDW